MALSAFMCWASLRHVRKTRKRSEALALRLLRTDPLMCLVRCVPVARMSGVAYALRATVVLRGTEYTGGVVTHAFVDSVAMGWFETSSPDPSVDLVHDETEIDIDFGGIPFDHLREASFDEVHDGIDANTLPPLTHPSTTVWFKPFLCVRLCDTRASPNFRL